MKLIPALVTSALILNLASCATYTTPGRPADMSTFTNPRVKKAYVARPAIRFPANIAVVRVQESGYRSADAKGYGSGAYSVVTTRDIEKAADIESLQKLPGIEGVVTLNRLMLPQSLNTAEDLREAAAQLQADAILIYTVDTEFRSDDVLPPLTVFSLGLLNINKYNVTSSASAILMDVRTGYIYGALEEGNDRKGGSFVFDGSDAIRKNAERAAFEKLIASFDPFWRKIYTRYR